MLLVYNPSRTEPDQRFDENNEARIRIVQDAGGKVRILEDFTGIDWDALDPQGEENTWKFRFLECV